MSRRVIVAVLLLAWTAGVRAADPPADPEPTVDEAAAKAYEEFTRRMAGQLARVSERLTRRYKLDDEQKADATKMIRGYGDAFLQTHGRELFGLMQRGRAIGELMREEGVTWQDMPADLRGDLLDRALTLMDKMQKQVLDFGESFTEILDDDQQAMFVKDRERMESQFRKARLTMRLMGGRSRRDAAATGAGASTTRPAGASFRRPGLTLGPWDAYVQRFIRRHRLDEVQKVKALDLLKEYKAKARRGWAASATRPASAPATRPTSRPTTRPTTGPATGAARMSLTDFRSRLAAVKRRRAPVGKLFEQLKAALETIPTPVQRKLAADADAADAAARRPKAAPTPRPAPRRSDGR